MYSYSYFKYLFSPLSQWVRASRSSVRTASVARGVGGGANLLSKLLVCLLMLALLLPASALAQETGVIEGQVVMGGEGSLPAGLDVEMLFLPNGQGPPVITSQPLPDEGSFRFTDVDTGPQHRYLVRVKVDGEDNFSDLLAFEPNESTKQVTLRLFERTTDASQLSLQEVNYIMDLQAGGWAVLGFYSYQNGGEQIIVNLTNPPAFIPLPTEARDVQFIEGIEPDAVVEMADGFAYSGPFAPGEISMIFSYALPYSEDEQTLTLPLGTEAQLVRVLVPQLGQKTTTDDLTSAGEQEFEGVRFELFEKTNPTASDTFTFGFSELPAAPTPEAQLGTENSTGTPSGGNIATISPLEKLAWWAPLLPAILAAFGVFGYLAVRPAPNSAETRANLRKRRDTLIAEIATLDIRFESGAIGEQTHRRQRKLLKQELKEVLRRLGIGDNVSD
ncbi:MAG: hypothetical protein ACPGWR_27465 [Ardenticatenaceae bacterium]